MLDVHFKIAVRILLVFAAFPVTLGSIYAQNDFNHLNTPRTGTIFDPPSIEQIETPQSTSEKRSPFPSLPPDPNADDELPLPSVEEELFWHGGSHLYLPEGDAAYANQYKYPGREWECQEIPHGFEHPEKPLLRLPENYCAPQPLTLWAEFLGDDPIQPYPNLTWFGPGGYHWEPRFVAFGSYSLIGLAFERDGTRQDGIGHQALVDFDLRLTGTERFHVQYRPIGRKNTGGSVYLLSDPQGYVDNSTGIPDRYWFECELSSVFSAWYTNPFTARDWYLSVGVQPIIFHNQLLLNDDVAGVVLTKNNLYIANASNVLWQAFYLFDNVDAFQDAGAQVVGTNAIVDYRHMFFEATYAYRTHNHDDSQDSHFLGLSGTKFVGPYTFAARSLFKIGDQGGTGDGQLFVLESNLTRGFNGVLKHGLGIDHGVFYANAFYATQGWGPIAGGGFNRLRNAFAVNPLVSIAQGTLTDAAGAALGVQFFDALENQSITPEVALETPEGDAVFGAGLLYQRKTSARSFLEFQGLINRSDNPTYNREGIFLSHTWFF